MDRAIRGRCLSFTSRLRVPGASHMPRRGRGGWPKPQMKGGQGDVPGAHDSASVSSTLASYLLWAEGEADGQARLHPSPMWLANHFLRLLELSTSGDLVGFFSRSRENTLSGV